MCLKESLRSFKPKKEWFYAFAIDAAMVLILFLMVLSFSKILNAQAYTLSEGKELEQVKMELLSGSAENSQEFAERMRGLALTFFAGIMIVGALGLFVFSTSQALIWYKLIGKKIQRNNYWKWNLMVIVFSIMALIYLAAYSLFLSAFTLLIPQGNTGVYLLSAISTFFILIAVWVIMLICYNFAHKYKVWEALGETFYQIKIHWTKMWKRFLFSYAVMVLLNVIILGILWGAAKLSASESILLVINAVLMLLYLAWLRVYIAERMRERQV